jgi:glutathione peroxidase-family protein
MRHRPTKRTNISFSLVTGFGCNPFLMKKKKKKKKEDIMNPCRDPYVYQFEIWEILTCVMLIV